MSRVFILNLLLIVFFVFTPSVSAQENEPELLKNMLFESINPGSPYYIFKRSKESFKLNFLTFGEQNKAKYIENLLDIRLKELSYMVKNGQTGILENGARRYTHQAGEVIEKYLKYNLGFKEQAKLHIPVLNRLRDYYPSNTADWLMIQESIDTSKRILGS